MASLDENAKQQTENGKIEGEKRKGSVVLPVRSDWLDHIVVAHEGNRPTIERAKHPLLRAFSSTCNPSFGQSRRKETERGRV
jgi:hypothetical protein